jgi:hypothetical protein
MIKIKNILSIVILFLANLTVAQYTSITSTDLFGNKQTNYGNGLSSISSEDILGNIRITFSDGTSATSIADIFGNMTTTFNNGVTAKSSTDIFGNTKTIYYGIEKQKITSIIAY